MKVPQKYLSFQLSLTVLNQKFFFLKKPIIDKFGVVSKEVAKKMSTEIIKYSKFTNIIGISCTGLASQNLEYSNKDQGIVYIATTYKSKTNVVEKILKLMIDLKLLI